MADKNPSAFPWMVDDGKTVTGNKGMTLRDYFAAKAMQAIVSKEVSHVSWVDEYAKNAYKMSDAMMKAREQ
jgi:hypothetical protein